MHRWDKERTGNFRRTHIGNIVCYSLDELIHSVAIRMYWIENDEVSVAVVGRGARRGEWLLLSRDLDDNLLFTVRPPHSHNHNSSSPAPSLSLGHTVEPWADTQLHSSKIPTKMTVIPPSRWIGRHSPMNTKINTLMAKVLVATMILRVWFSTLRSTPLMTTV